MSHMGKVLAEMGVLPPDAVKQFQRWKNPAVESIDPEKIPTEAASPEAVVRAIDEVMQERATVTVKETDLDALAQYKQTKTEAFLHIEDMEGQAADVSVTVGRLRTGEFIFPWTSAGIEELMVNGFTALHFEEAPYHSAGITFSDVRELYFGDDLVFMACMPRQRLGKE